MSEKEKIISEIIELKEFYEGLIEQDRGIFSTYQKKTTFYQIAEASVKQFEGFIKNLDTLIKNIS